MWQKAHSKIFFFWLEMNGWKLTQDSSKCKRSFFPTFLFVFVLRDWKHQHTQPNLFFKRRYPKKQTPLKKSPLSPLDVIPSFLPKRCHFRSHKRKHQIVAHCASLLCLLSSCNFRGRWTLACICKKNLHVLCPIACHYYLVLLTRTFLC